MLALQQSRQEQAAGLALRSKLSGNMGAPARAANPGALRSAPASVSTPYQEVRPGLREHGWVHVPAATSASCGKMTVRSHSG